ncbi:hypothetical protein [Methylobacterium sp. JK268]
MPHHDTVALSGIIRHVFAHRFTLEAEGALHLADLGPKGAEAFPLAAGLPVSLEGERRPSEIKVTRIAAEGREPVLIHHKKPHHAPADGRPDRPADMGAILAAVASAGWTQAGEPRRKPKHVEILARRDGDAVTELHVDLAGHVYKTKTPDPAKWGAALG